MMPEVVFDSIMHGLYMFYDMELKLKQKHEMKRVRHLSRILTDFFADNLSNS